jgi:zinc transport system substrate-binding protein
MVGSRSVVGRAARLAATFALCLAPGAHSEARAETPAKTSAENRVVVTSKPIHALVSGVMGALGQPVLLVSGNTSPHTFAMKPSDAKAVNAAQVFFRVSADLEPFTAKLIKSLAATVRVETLANAPGLRLLAKREGGEFEGHADHAGHTNHAGHGAKRHHAKAETSQTEVDTHLWLDPANAGVMTTRIAAVLGEVDPANAAQYAANATALIAQHAVLAADLRRVLAPVAERQFVVFHDAYQYFEAWAGLSAAGSITTNPDVQPTGKRLSMLRAKIKTAGVTCVFAEPQFQPKVIAAVTEGLPVRTGTLDPEGTTLEPGVALYDQLMRKLAADLVSCLAG